MKSRQKIQYTIRNISPSVNRALRQKATRTHKSLNEVALKALARGTGIAEKAQKHRDLAHFFGSWIQDDAIETALTEQRTVDQELWSG